MSGRTVGEHADGRAGGRSLFFSLPNLRRTRDSHPLRTRSSTHLGAHDSQAAAYTNLELKNVALGEAAARRVSVRHARQERHRAAWRGESRLRACTGRVCARAHVRACPFDVHTRPPTCVPKRCTCVHARPPAPGALASAVLPMLALASVMGLLIVQVEMWTRWECGRRNGSQGLTTP